MQLAPLATWVKCHNASKRSVFISSSAKFHLIENYPAGSGTIASPALIFSKEVPTTRCRFFFKRLFQKIRVENKFIRDKVQMVKNAMPGRRLSLFFIFGWRHREKSCEASKFSSRDCSYYKNVQSYTSKCYNFELDSFLETPQTHTTVSAVYRFLVTHQPNRATFEKTRNTHFTTFPSAAAVVTTC